MEPEVIKCLGVILDHHRFMHPLHEVGPHHGSFGIRRTNRLHCDDNLLSLSNSYWNINVCLIH